MWLAVVTYCNEWHLANLLILVTVTTGEPTISLLVWLGHLHIVTSGDASNKQGSYRQTGNSHGTFISLETRDFAQTGEISCVCVCVEGWRRARVCRVVVMVVGGCGRNRETSSSRTCASRRVDVKWTRIDRTSVQAVLSGIETFQARTSCPHFTASGTDVFSWRSVLSWIDSRGGHLMKTSCFYKGREGGKKEFSVPFLYLLKVTDDCQNLLVRQFSSPVTFCTCSKK